MRWLLGVAFVCCGIVAVLIVLHARYNDVSQAQGGMRVVLRIPNRAEYDYTLTAPITEINKIGALKSQLITLVRKQLGWKSAPGDPTKADAHDPASMALQVDFTGDRASIITAALSNADAQAQLGKITLAMKTVFPAAHAFTSPDPASVFQSANSMQDTVRLILEKRLNPAGTMALHSFAQGDDEIVLEISGEHDPDHVTYLLTADAHISFSLLSDNIDVEENDNQQGVTLVDKMTGKEINAPEALKSAVTILDGTALAPTSHMEYDPFNGKPEIAFSILGEANQQHFGAMTEGNLERTLAIVRGTGARAEIISAPVIKARIDRRGVITGNFTVQQATEMATLFNAGALPVQVQIVESRVMPK